jgi:3-oxoacyl-[acyl-carrier-protein] synthase-3
MAGQVTTLQRIEAFAPSRSATIEEVASSVGLNRHQARMFRRIRGIERMRWDPDLDLFDLVCAPAETLLKTEPERETIRYLIFAHTFQDLTPSYINATDRIRERLGLTSAESFAVTQQNCASGLAAIDIAGELLMRDGDASARALVITGEKPFTGIVRFMVNVSIMGEASSACLVGLGGEGGRLRSYAVRTAGQFSDGFRMAPEVLRDFNDTYNPALAEVMSQALADAGLDLSDITMVVPHNVNVSSWWRLCSKLDLDRDRVFLDNVPQFSHCYCTDPFVNLVSMRERGLLVKGGRYLVTSVGIGSTYAAMVIEY